MTSSDRQDRHFLSEGKCKSHLGLAPEHMPILSLIVLLSQLLGGRHPGKRIYFSFFVLFSLVINTKRACMELGPGT